MGVSNSSIIYDVHWNMSRFTLQRNLSMKSYELIWYIAITNNMSLRLPCYEL